MHVVTHAGELYCKDCFKQSRAEGQHVDTALLEYLYDVENNLLGFKCPNCKQLWSISSLGK